MQVVLGDGLQPLPRDATTAGDVLQERHDIVGSFGAAEGQQQQRVDVAGHSSCVLAPPSAKMIVPVVAGSQSDSSAHTVLATGVGSFMSQPSGAR